MERYLETLSMDPAELARIRFDGTLDAVALGGPANLQLQDFTTKAGSNVPIRRLPLGLARYWPLLWLWIIWYSFGIWNDGRLSEQSRSG